MKRLKANSRKRIWRGVPLICLCLLWPLVSRAQLPAQLTDKLNSYPHATTVTESQADVRDHEIGLGAIQKRGGAWRFKHSERHSGLLRRHTWQIVDGFTSIEVLAELEAELGAVESSELLFACAGRSCGQGVQWANRVFGERMLYGREELQRYRVYAIDKDKDAPYFVILYSSARTADRQYLHMESLLLASEP